MTNFLNPWGQDRLRRIMAIAILLAVLLSGLLPHVTLAANLTISTCDEATLRSAIGEATPGDSLQFGCSGTISLTSGGPITVDKNISLDGSGQNVVISGSNTTNIFLV